MMTEHMAALREFKYKSDLEVTAELANELLTLTSEKAQKMEEVNKTEDGHMLA